jgi:ornithine cyclodeaminase/alanine dehydrogenase
MALIDASYLTAVRTGAVTGVAAGYLARRNSRTAAVIGCGIQGRTQAQALAESTVIENLMCYDISRIRSQTFAEEMSRELGLDVIPSETSQAAVGDADIIATATTSRTPVIQRTWLKEGAFISAIGSFYSDHREIDSATVRDAKVVVDSKEAVFAEAGDIILPMKEGVITADHIYAELGELVTGTKKGRTDSDNITLFKSVGLAIQDSSVAALVVRKWVNSFG